MVNDMQVAGAGLPEPRVLVVRAELERILASAAFRGSRRCQEFLSYIVCRALEGRSDLLKERTVGVEVFGRQADYDTGDDSIVRVKANEVRKRLAQYYQEAGPTSPVHIELPAGSYVPEFRWPASEPVPPPPAPPSRLRSGRRWTLALIGIAVLVAGTAAATLWINSRPSVLGQFWEPVFRSDRPVLLCIAHPVVFHVPTQYRDNPAASVPMSEVIRDPDHYVGLGDALAVSQLSAFFARSGKPSQVRAGTDTSFTDLRYSPAVLIGAFTNQWTMELAKDFRFIFDRENGDPVVRDQQAPGHRWVRTRTNPPSDFAIVSRVFVSKTGEPVIIAAGLSHLGTQIAGEFLTNAGYLEDALRGAPADWHSKNLQIVLRAEVIGNIPGPPKALATYYW